MANRQFGHPNDPRFTQQHNQPQQGAGGHGGNIQGGNIQGQPQNYGQQPQQAGRGTTQQPQYQTPQYQQPQSPQYQTPHQTSQSGYAPQTQQYSQPQHTSQQASPQQRYQTSQAHVGSSTAASLSDEVYQARSNSQMPGSDSASRSASLGGYSPQTNTPSSRDANAYASQQSGADYLSRSSAAADFSHASTQPSAFDHATTDYSSQNSGYQGFQSSDPYSGDAASHGGFGQADLGHATAHDGMYASSDYADASFADGEYDDEGYDEEGGSRNYMLMVAVLVGALGIGGALAYAYKYGPLGGDQMAGIPPVITADGSPMKEKPQVAGGKKFENGGKLFYDRLGSDQTTTGSTSTPERMVPREEKVVGAANTGNPNGPRKVQTLTVLPNGRIVNAEAKPTAATAPNVPTIKATNVKTVTPTPVARTGGPSIGTGFKATTQSSSSQNIAMVTPKVAPQTQKVVIPSAVRPAQSVAESGYVVQVAARRNQSDALVAFADLQQKYPNILQSYKPLIQRADLGAKGVWYRLRVGPLGSKESAAELCSRLKEAGQSCLVTSL